MLIIVTTETSTIKESTLRELVEANPELSACVVGIRGGYVILLRYGIVERQLASTRGGVRLFTLDNASKFLRDVGLKKFVVDATDYEHARMRKARPDRSEAMKGTGTKLRQQNLI
jgi:hypothetical protein